MLFIALTLRQADSGNITTFRYSGFLTLYDYASYTTRVKLRNTDMFTGKVLLSIKFINK